VEKDIKVRRLVLVVLVVEALLGVVLRVPQVLQPKVLLVVLVSLEQTQVDEAEAAVAQGL
tara:strand:+ start:282 stop:461 length:180 start_codon:yes stop_codon:yes gene_type:complete